MRVVPSLLLGAGVDVIPAPIFHRLRVRKGRGMRIKWDVVMGVVGMGLIWVGVGMNAAGGVKWGVGMLAVGAVLLMAGVRWWGYRKG